MKARRRPPHSEELRARLGINLRECRERLGISQFELAFRSETNTTGVSPLELGQRLPRIDTFIRLAGALEVGPNELVAGIVWTPAEPSVVGGSFEVPSDPALAAEVAALREASPRRWRQSG